MAENTSAQALESSFDEVRQLQSSVHKQTLSNASKENELHHLDVLLAGLREVNQFYSKKSVRLQRELEKRDVALIALNKEKENLSTILISSKANYLEELLDAERKIKKLENSLNEIKLFVVHDVLLANETVSGMIRLRYGDDNNNVIKPTAANMSDRAPDLSKTTEPIGVPSTSAAAATKLDTLSADSPSMEVEKEPSNLDQQEAAVENQSDVAPEEVIEIMDDEQSDAEMATDKPNLLKRFPCGECSRSFSTMALKYRHEVRVHSDTQEVEQESERVEKAKKPLKRLHKGGKIHPERNLVNFLQNVLDFGAVNSIPMPRQKRTKKIAGKKNK